MYQFSTQMMKQPQSKESRDYANEHHIIRKKKAEASQFHAKNIKHVIEEIEIDDEEIDIKAYARYIK
jgi:hypothetical protein